MNSGAWPLLPCGSAAPTDLQGFKKLPAPSRKLTLLKCSCGWELLPGAWKWMKTHTRQGTRGQLCRLLRAVMRSAGAVLLWS